MGLISPTEFDSLDLKGVEEQIQLRLLVSERANEMDQLYGLRQSHQMRRCHALRDKTGLGLMRCKDLLIRAKWDVDAAVRLAFQER